jgi:hypothetical protein
MLYIRACECLLKILAIPKVIPAHDALTFEPSVQFRNGSNQRFQVSILSDSHTRDSSNKHWTNASRAFIHDYDRERPHQALNMQYPAEFYTSPQPYTGYRSCITRSTI